MAYFQKIKQCSIIGTLEGGRELADRLHSAQETAAHPVSGKWIALYCAEIFWENMKI